MLKYEYESDAYLQCTRAYDATLQIIKEALQEAQEAGTAKYADTALIIKNIFEAMPQAHVKKSLLVQHDEVSAYAVQVIEYYLSIQALRMITPNYAFNVRSVLQQYNTIYNFYVSFLSNDNENISWHTYANNEKHVYNAIRDCVWHIDVAFECYGGHTQAYNKYIDNYKMACKDLGDPANAVRLAFAYMAFASDYASKYQAKYIQHSFASARAYAKVNAYIDYEARADVWQEASELSIARIKEYVHHAYHILTSLSTRVNISVIKDALNALAWQFIFHEVDTECEDLRCEVGKARQDYFDAQNQKAQAQEQERHSTQAYGIDLLNIHNTDNNYHFFAEAVHVSSRASYCQNVQSQSNGLERSFQNMAEAQVLCHRATKHYHEARMRYLWLVPLLNTYQSYRNNLNSIISKVYPHAR